MRLDLYLAESGMADSRTDAKNFILSGSVTVNGKAVIKPSFSVSGEEEILLDKSSKKYVSRGGLKLEGALSAFEIDASSRYAIDVGASSGGFTDCLLKHGASRVIAVDSGVGQLAESLRADPRVVVIENYNARYMKREDLEYIPDLAVMDVSFISATLLIEPIYDCLADGGEFVCLIKPQFEVGRSGLGKGGIVKDDKVRRGAVDKVVSFALSKGFVLKKVIDSPIEGGDGNKEFLAHFIKETNFEKGNNHTEFHEGQRSFGYL